MNIIWLLLGGLLAIVLIAATHKRPDIESTDQLGIALLIAALMYVCFALTEREFSWLWIELIGVPLYGLFYWLARRSTALWLAAGWLLHPAWDVGLHLQGNGIHIAPMGYVIACISFDVIVGLYILWRFRPSTKHQVG